MVDNQYATLELRIHKRKKLPDSAKLHDLMKEWGMNVAAQESFWVVTYDSSTNMRTVVEVARGSYRDVMVSIPTVLAAVLKSGADRFIAIHNHPGGNPEPTEMDMNLTRKLMDGANACSLYFEDHVILSPDGRHVSLTERGLLIPSPDLATRAQQGAIKARRPRVVRFVLQCDEP